MQARSQIILVVIVVLISQTATAFSIVPGRRSRDRTAEIIEALNKVIQDAPEDSAMYASRALYHQMRRDQAMALADYSKAIELDPTNPALYRFRANCWSNQRETNQAISDLDQAIRLNPDHAPTYCDRAIHLALKHQWESAQADYAKALELEPLNPEFHFEHAMYFAARRERLAAIDELDTVLQLKPQYELAYALRGWQYLMLGNFSQAVEDYTDVIKTDPRNASAFIHRSIARMQQREFGKALADLQRAAELDPHQVNPRDLRYVATELLNAANRKLAELAEQSPDPVRESTARRDRGFANRALERWSEAQADLDEAIRLDQSSSLAYSIRGRLWLRQQEWDQAIQDFSNSLRLNPQDATVWTDRGIAYFEKKQWAAAADDFTQALEIDSQHQLALAYRAMTWQSLGKPDQALADYEDVICGAPFYESTFVLETHRPSEPPTGGQDREPAHSPEPDGDDSQFEPAKVGLRLNASGDGAFITENANDDRPAQRHASLTDGEAAQISGPAKQTTYVVFLHSRYLNAYLSHAALASQKNDWDSVCLDYEELIKLAPSDPQGYRRYAWLRATCPAAEFRNGEQAVQLGKKAVELGHSAQDYLALAAAYAEQGDFAMAVNSQSQAREIALESLEKSLQDLRQEYRAAEFEHLLEADERKPDSDNTVNVETAKNACERTDWKDSQAIENLANAYAAAGQLEKALDCVDRLHELKLNDLDPSLRALLELYQSGKPFRAVRAEDQRVVDGAESSFVAKLEAISDAQQIGVGGLPPRALSVAQIRLLSLEPPANENRGSKQTTNATNQISSEESRRAAELAIQTQRSANVSRLIRQGLVFQKRGQFESAISSFQEAIQTDPTDADSFDRLAWLLATCKNDQIRNGPDALKQALIACELSHRKTWNHLFTLAAAYAETGDFKSAIECAEAAIELITFDEPESETERLKASLELFRSNQPVRDE